MSQHRSRKRPRAGPHRIRLRPTTPTTKPQDLPHATPPLRALKLNQTADLPETAAPTKEKNSKNHTRNLRRKKKHTRRWDGSGSGGAGAHPRRSDQSGGREGNFTRKISRGKAKAAHLSQAAETRGWGRREDRERRPPPSLFFFSSCPAPGPSLVVCVRDGFQSGSERHLYSLPGGPAGGAGGVERSPYVAGSSLIFFSSPNLMMRGNCHGQTLLSEEESACWVFIYTVGYFQQPKIYLLLPLSDVIT